MLSKVPQMNILAGGKRMGIFCWWLFLFAEKVFGAKDFVDDQLSYKSFAYEKFFFLIVFSRRQIVWT